MKKSKILSVIGQVANNLGLAPAGGAITTALRTSGYGRRKARTAQHTRRHMGMGMNHSMRHTGHHGAGAYATIDGGFSKLLF